MYPFLTIASNTLTFSNERQFYSGKKKKAGIILERCKELTAIGRTAKIKRI